MSQQRVFIHPLARMLPLLRLQSQVYRLADKFPPGIGDSFAPIWEVVSFNPGARQTQQARVNFQRDFHLLAVIGSSSAAGGFRLQIYDKKKAYLGARLPKDRKEGKRLSERGVVFGNFCGLGKQPFFLREPHPFTEQNAQALVIVQNQDTAAANTIQVVLYGLARRFNYPN